MESHTNENIRSNLNAIDDASARSQTLSDNHNDVVQKDNDDVKISVPVAEALHAVVNQGNRTVERIFRTIETTTPSSLTSILPNTTPFSCSRIVDEESIHISGETQQCELTPTTGFQINLTTTDNRQQQPKARNHIMISYNRATATTVCQKIYDRLKEKGHRVWFDRTNLTSGSILNGMGEAIEGAYVVLLCMNEGYEKSSYCLDEAKYAREKKVRVIPCMMEEGYEPRGALGFIKSDLMHIEFFNDLEFEENFQKLAHQINNIAAAEGIRPVSENNIDFCDYFKNALTDLILSSQRWPLRLRNLDEPQLTIVLRTLIQEFSPETLQSFRNDLSNGVSDGQRGERDNDRLIQHLLKNNEELVASLRAEQENRARREQRFHDEDERISAVQRLLQREEQERVRPNDNNHLMSLFRIEELYRQGQDRNDHIVEQLLRQTQRLTELVVNQQEQHLRDRKIWQEQTNRSSEASSEVQSTFHVDSALVKNVIKTIVLLYTLFVLFRNI